MDGDPFDARCDHTLIEEQQSGKLVGCFRTLTLDAADITTSYAAQFYDLSALEAYNAPVIELGRFCIDPSCTDPDVLRLAWAVLTSRVDETAAGMLFGCSSFHGTDPAPYLDTFSHLYAKHLAPAQWRPGIKSREVVDFVSTAPQTADRQRALQHMPALLRSYVSMGGWVSDHAVIDPLMGTLHVFTGLEVSNIPPARRAALRAMVRE